jgi:hypothetical protein
MTRYRVVAQSQGLESLRDTFKAVEFERALTQRASQVRQKAHFAASMAQARREQQGRALKARRG